MTSKDFCKAKRYRAKNKSMKLFLRFLKQSRMRKNRRVVKQVLNKTHDSHSLGNVNIANKDSWKLY